MYHKQIEKGQYTDENDDEDGEDKRQCRKLQQHTCVNVQLHQHRCAAATIKQKPHTLTHEHKRTEDII